MDFQIPNGTRIFPSIKPEYLDQTTGEFIAALQFEDIFTLTSGKLIIRLVFHQLDPDQVQVLKATPVDLVHRKRSKVEGSDDGK
jgi:hypothetical protein